MKCFTFSAKGLMFDELNPFLDRNMIVWENTPALWSEVLDSCVGLVGGEDRNLLAIGTFGRGDDFILCGEDSKFRTEC